MPDYIKTTVSLDVGKVLTAAEQLAAATQLNLQRTLYPEYYKIQDQINKLITDIKAYNAKTLNKKVRTVSFNLDDNTISQEVTE